jgi:hypothetical protein
MTETHAVIDADGRLARLAETAGHAHGDMRPIDDLGAVRLAERAYDSNAARDIAEARDV